jgi:hypothetical protein
MRFGYVENPQFDPLTALLLWRIDRQLEELDHFVLPARRQYCVRSSACSMTATGGAVDGPSDGTTRRRLPRGL